MLHEFLRGRYIRYYVRYISISSILLIILYKYSVSLLFYSFDPTCPGITIFKSSVFSGLISMFLCIHYTFCLKMVTMLFGAQLFVSFISSL